MKNALFRGTAAAALILCGSAQAQSSVTLYGIADSYFGRESSTNAAGVKTDRSLISAGGMSTSRWGVRGTEDLGGGYQAFFNLEQGFSLDTAVAANEGQAFGRASLVGVGGPFGTVAFGRMLTVYDGMRSATDPLGHAPAWSPSFLIYPRDGSGHFARYNNGVRYLSPNIGGLTVGLTYALGEGDGTSGIALSARYKMGDAELMFGRQEDESVGSPKGKNTNTLIGGTYTLGKLKLFGNYNINELKNGFRQGGLAATATTGTTAFPSAAITAVPNGKNPEWHLGATYQIGGAHVLYADYARSTGKAASQSGADSSFAVVYMHNLSKRTGIYVAHRRNSEKDAASRTRISLTGLGIRHYF